MERECERDSEGERKTKRAKHRQTYTHVVNLNQRDIDKH